MTARPENRLVCRHITINTDIGGPMKAAVFHAPNTPLTIEDVSLQKPGSREVLIHALLPLRF